MDESLLTYYNRELAYIRKMGAEFADKHPKIASRLRLDRDAVEDPHVSRLIESFAFLTARIRHTIDDSFPEITEALIGLLYPAYHAPLPSMSILKCRVIPEVPQYQLVAAGSELLVKAGDYGDCRFRTCDDVEVLPLEFSQVRFLNAPVAGAALPPELAAGRTTKAVLKAELKAIGQAQLNTLENRCLRLFVNAQPQVAYRLIEFLATRLTGVTLCQASGQTLLQALPAERVSFPHFDMLAAGGGEDFNTGRSSGRNNKGYLELTDYFVFPQKFLFFDIELPEGFWLSVRDTFTLILHFDDTHPELVQAIDDQSLQLGCVPMINLYEDKTEYIDSSDCLGEVKLRVQPQRHRFADVHSVHRVKALNDRGETLDIPPFYGDQQQGEGQNRRWFWHLRRENTSAAHGYSTQGTEAYIALTDQNFEFAQPDQRWLIQAEVSCTNRDIPSRLPFGPDQPRFDFIQGGAGLRQECLVAPTKTCQPALEKQSRWHLIAQLGLQSFVGDRGLETLRTALSLYDLRNSRETQAAIHAIQSLSVAHINERIIVQGKATMCIGLRCDLVIDETAFTGSSLYLFGYVLHRFFSSLCALNSFVATHIRGQHSQDVHYHWAPSPGGRPLL